MRKALARYELRHASKSMRDAALAFQTRFHIEFDTLTHFSAETLKEMHALRLDEPELMKQVFVASENDRTTFESFDVLTRIANLSAPGLSDRTEYFAALQSVYRRLEPPLAGDESRLVVAPEREGRIMGEALGWLRPQDLAPHAKRIPYEHGLLVGISHCVRVLHAPKIVCIDGAIASGATLVALLDLLAAPGASVEIYSVHAAREGLRAILRFATMADLSVRIHVGHVTEGLCAKFYATEQDGVRLVVGDLGDMIASVAVAAGK